MKEKNEKTALFKALFLTTAVVVALLIFWEAISVFLLAYAAILFAIFLHMISDWLTLRFLLPYRLSLSLLILGIGVALVLLFWIATPLISNQLAQLFEELPKAYTQFKEITSSFINWQLFTKENFAQEFRLINGKLLSQAQEIFSFTIGGIVGFVVFIIVGIYLAYTPEVYVRGFLKLIPTKNRRKVEQVIHKMGQTLRWWLLGKCLAMLSIGFLTMLGLWILNVPLAFILGLLSGLLAFIPYIGPILAAIPAILIGLTQYPLKGLYVTLLYLFIHALEGYLITPYIEQQTVSLPPALTILSQILLTLLIGFLGLALASPLLVIALVVVTEVWVKRKVVKNL